MRKRLRKIKNIFIKKRNDIYSIIKKGKFEKNIAIISCDKYCEKIREDIELKYYLLRSNIYVDILSWKSDVDFNKYDALIIRSVWDFQEDVDSFLNWLSNIKIPVFNDLDLIKNNIDKENQYKLMDKYNIKHVETVFLKKKFNISDVWKNNFDKYDKLVLKPCISESGKNTYLINKKNINDVNLSNNDSKMMIQPFMDGIKDGEYSVIYFNHKFSHCILRHSGVLETENTIYEVTIDKKLLDICNKIDGIEEYKNYLFLRLDFIKQDDEYLLLEVELIDPMLFINKCNNKKNIYKNFANEIKKNIFK